MGIKFSVHNELERYRAETLYTKEPGTIRWLNSSLKPGDVFYDIGANIGCYTLVAAELVGPTGTVYAFEPHVGSAHSLLRNVHKNSFQDRVKLLCVPLGAGGRWVDFGYSSLEAGATDNQVDGTGEIVELKRQVTIDGLRQYETIKPAKLVKIDVDGREAVILAGMERLLHDFSPSVQVEIHPSTRDNIFAFMDRLGYHCLAEHRTAGGEEAIKAGYDPAIVFVNAIFERNGHAEAP